MQKMPEYSRMALTLIKKKLCDKYEISLQDFSRYCINRFRNPKTNEIYYIENMCQCNKKETCDFCHEFWVLDTFTHDHPNCKECKKLRGYYMAQAEYKYLYDNESIGIEFMFQTHYSSIFGGLCGLKFDELEPIVESAKKVYNKRFEM